MPAARVWKIVPIAGDNPGIVLGDSAQPHGRPRHGPMVTDKMVLRHRTTRYPGSNQPTRHIFGDMQEPWVLTGRWEDAKLASQLTTANQLVTQIKLLLRDAIPVRIEWGEVLAATGLIVAITPGRESATVVMWTLEIEIDSDDALTAQDPLDTPTSPLRIVRDIKGLTTNLDVSRDLPDLPFPYPSNLLESIDTWVSSIAGLTGTLVNIANDIDSFQRAAYGELQRLRGALGQQKTALLILENAWNDASNDVAMQSADANTQTSYAKSRAEQLATINFMLTLNAQLDDMAQQAAAGSKNTTARAKGGDTWESISTQKYGSADRAPALREANAVRGGAKPKPGRIIHIPGR